jgi:hypothetical protein
VNLRVHHRHRRVGLEWQLAGQHLVGDDAERVLIGGGGGGFSFAGFRAHVSRGAYDRAGLGQTVSLGGLRNAEVGDDTEALVVEHDVAGFDVPGDHAVAVGEVERCSYLGEDRADDGEGQGDDFRRSGRASDPVRASSRRELFLCRTA